MRHKYEWRKPGLSYLNEPAAGVKMCVNTTDYPDMRGLYERFGQFYNLNENTFILGNGCENVLKSVLMALTPYSVSYSIPCWGFLDVYREQLGFRALTRQYRMEDRRMLDEDFAQEGLEVYYASWPSNNYFATEINWENMKCAPYTIIDLSYCSPLELRQFIDGVFSSAGHTILVGSFDKMLGCGLRFGFAIFPNSLSQPMNIQREQFINSCAAEVCMKLGDVLKEHEFVRQRDHDRLSWLDGLGCLYRNFNFAVFEGRMVGMNGKTFLVDGKEYTRFGIPRDEEQASSLKRFLSSHKPYNINSCN